MFLDILVAVDGSEHAAQALRTAAQLAQEEHARLTVISVVATPRVTYRSRPARMPAASWTCSVAIDATLIRSGAGGKQLSGDP